MSHTVTYNSKLGLVETKAKGELGLEEAKEIIAQIGLVAKENSCFLCLSDYREVKLTLSTIEIYEIPKILSKTITSLSLAVFKFKRAIVFAKGSRDFYFLETVTINNGQYAQLFEDMEGAKKWLLGG